MPVSSTQKRRHRNEYVNKNTNLKLKLPQNQTTCVPINYNDQLYDHTRYSRIPKSDSMLYNHLSHDTGHILRFTVALLCAISQTAVSIRKHNIPRRSTCGVLDGCGGRDTVSAGTDETAGD